MVASVSKAVEIDAHPDDVWDAVREFGALHKRLAPGFVVDCRLEGEDTRIVTFANGAVAREVLIAIDDAARRLAYSVVESPLGFTHNSASVQVLNVGGGHSRLVWITDLLPDDLAPRTAELMEQGGAAIKTAMESADAVSDLESAAVDNGRI